MIKLYIIQPDHRLHSVDEPDDGNVDEELIGAATATATATCLNSRIADDDDNAKTYFNGHDPRRRCDWGK